MVLAAPSLTVLSEGISNPRQEPLAAASLLFACMLELWQDRFSLETLGVCSQASVSGAFGLLLILRLPRKDDSSRIWGLSSQLLSSRI